MYPGVASNKIIPVFKTNEDCFKENDDKSVLPPITSPSVNIGELEEAYLITVATPGLHREDFHITTENAILSISAKKDAIQSIYINDRYEYDYSEWTRVFRLPNDADTLMTNAEYIQGELIIRIPRNESKENKTNSIIYVY
jgi:HSP20 family protein